MAMEEIFANFKMPQGGSTAPIENPGSVHFRQDRQATLSSNCTCVVGMKKTAPSSTRDLFHKKTNHFPMIPSILSNIVHGLKVLLKTNLQVSVMTDMRVVPTAPVPHFPQTQGLSCGTVSVSWVLFPLCHWVFQLSLK